MPSGGSRFMHWLWGVAEKMEWDDRRPRWFWRWLLKRLDRHHGHHLEYDE
jgi:hypothetical protein